MFVLWRDIISNDQWPSLNVGDAVEFEISKNDRGRTIAINVTVRVQGNVKWFDKSIGYGFLTRKDGEKDVSVHYKDIKGDGFESVRDGDEVEFEILIDDRGTKAINVTRPGGEEF